MMANRDVPQVSDESSALSSWELVFDSFKPTQSGEPVDWECVSDVSSVWSNAREELEERKAEMKKRKWAKITGSRPVYQKPSVRLVNGITWLHPLNRVTVTAQSNNS